MLSVALGLFIAAIVSAVIGFGQIAPGMATPGKVFFFAFLVTSVGALIAALSREPKKREDRS